MTATIRSLASSEQTVEDAAQYVFGAMNFDRDTSFPWVEHGNSDAQARARAAARDIIRLVADKIDAELYVEPETDEVSFKVPDHLLAQIKDALESCSQDLQFEIDARYPADVRATCRTSQRRHSAESTPVFHAKDCLGLLSNFFRG